MKTRLPVLASLALGFAVAANGCADNRASVQIQAICFPTATCSVSGACDLVLTGTPTVSITGGTAPAGNDLVLMLQVENQLPDNADPQQGRLNTNDAHVDEVAIEYVAALPAAETKTNAWLPAGETGIVLIAIPVPAGAPVGGILSRVRLRGYYDDGSRFETGEFPIMFEVCSGCVTAPACTGDVCPPGAGAQDPAVCITPAAPAAP